MGKEGEIAAGRDAGGPLWHDLVEREEELSVLEVALEEAGAGSGRFLFVEGAPGIGKTSLLQAVRTLAAEDGMRVLSARGSELERDFPYAIVQQLFDPLLRDPQMPRELLLEGSARAALEVFHPEPIVRGAASTAAPPTDPFAAMHGLYWLTCNALDRGPLVLLIDDAQWADPASLRFIGFMQARLAELPLLIALAARMGESETNPLLARLSADVASRPIRLGPLSAEAVSLLVRAATSDDADASFCIACRDASGGNPYILRELLVDLGARGMAPTAETAGGVASLAPASVVRSVLLRLAPFGPEGTALARAVATLGDSAELRHAAALAGLAHDDAGRVAQELARVGLLAPERAISFAHPVTRAAVYADMRPAQRAELHARAAELLATEGAETDAVAAHLLAAEPSGDSAVVRTLRDAAAGALARGGAEAAVTYLRRALAEPPPPAAAPGVLLELGAAGFRAGIPDPTIDAFGRGFASCNDPVERARFARPYSLTLWAVGQSARAYDLIASASKEAATQDPELALRLAAEALALSRLDPTLLPRGYEQARAPELRLLPGDTAGERLMLAALAYTDTWSGGSASESGQLAERALAGELALGGESAEWLAFHEGVYALIASDRLQVARATLETALDFARLRGSALGLVSCLAFRSHLALRSGLVTAAEADAREAVALAREQGWLMATPWVLAFLIDALVERGELAEADQQLEASGVGASIPSHRITVLHLLFSRARLRLAQGNAEAALGDLGELASRKRQWGIIEVAGTPGAALEASALASLGKRREAVARSQEALREARVWGTPRAVGIALRARGIAEERQAGIDLLREATDMLEASPASLEYARAQTDLGAALRRARKRAEARVPLRAALERARRCGAHALARRAHEELEATGERLPRPVPIEPGSLTPSERRVAELAARGMTNREIAQTLFLTVRTVEAHLTATYRKLDIDSRRLLARYLTEPAAQQSPSRSTRGIATSR